MSPAVAGSVRRPAVPHFRGAPVHLPRADDGPDPADPESVAAWVASQGQPTAIDLFAGAGGLSLGLRDAGFRVLVGADSDPLAVETHEANIGGLGFCGDLSQVDELLEVLLGWGIRTVDLIAGGPPCQAFSRAGRSRLRELVATGARSKQDPRAHLWTAYAKVVDALRPKAVLMENVPDLAAWDDGAVLIGFMESLRRLGYHVEARILEAWRYGVPQHRSRLFIVGVTDDLEFVWPEPITQVPTLRDAIGDLPAVGAAQRREMVRYWAESASSLARRMRRDVPDDTRDVLYDHITRDVREDDAEAFALLPEGGTYEDLPPRLQRYRTDIFSDKYKRLEWDQLSRSITAHLAKDGYWYIHPEQHRTLSVREAARVQTFPDWFRFAGEPTHRYRQIGNAVPPLLAEALGRSIVRSLTSRERLRAAPAHRGHSGFREELLRWHAGNRRDLPWRPSADPWHVLIAELCLRRTPDGRIRSAYDALVGLAPTPQALVLAGADGEVLLQDMGLPRRSAENLMDCAQVLVDVYGGSVPDQELELQTLPGVGDYVTQAVLSFGFGRRAVLLDSTTLRVVGRLLGRSERHRRWQHRLDLYSLAGEDGPDAAFNAALLDLAVLTCRSSVPQCDRCPLIARCVHRSARERAATRQLAFDAEEATP